MSYINEHKDQLKENNYIQKARNETHYWFNFSVGKLNNYKRKFQNNFCLIINGSDNFNDAYILPFSIVSNLFTEDFIVDGHRWNGNIYNDQLRLVSKGKSTRTLSIGAYYNAFDLLNQGNSDDQYFEENFIEIQNNDITHKELINLISLFNQKYNSISPEKKIIFSNRIDRPQIITDYLKNIHNYKCQICGLEGFKKIDSSRYVEAHHIIELHKLIPGSLCSDNIIVVCANCHRKLHYAKVYYEVLGSSKVIIKINDERKEIFRNIISQLQ